MDPWFILYDGTSPDGRGSPQFCGRTTDPIEARKHFLKCDSDPYSTGRVRIVTDREEGIAWRLDDFDPFIPKP